MRAVLRVLAAGFLALALVLLVSDGTAMLAADSFVFTPLATTITSFFPGLLDSAQAALAALHPLLWEPAITTLLSWPGWAVTGAIGLALAVAGRSPSRHGVISIDPY